MLLLFTLQHICIYQKSVRHLTTGIFVGCVQEPDYALYLFVSFLQVVLTDNEDKVLFNLRDCVAINSDASSPHAAMALPSSPTRAASLGPHNMSAPAEATSDAYAAAAAALSGQCQDRVAAVVQHGAAADDRNVADADEPCESLLDPEDADSCDDLDGFFKHADPHSVAARDTISWDHVSLF